METGSTQRGNRDPEIRVYAALRREQDSKKLYHSAEDASETIEQDSQKPYLIAKIVEDATEAVSMQRESHAPEMRPWMFEQDSQKQNYGADKLEDDNETHEHDFQKLDHIAEKLEDSANTLSTHRENRAPEISPFSALMLEQNSQKLCHASDKLKDATNTVNTQRENKITERRPCSILMLEQDSQKPNYVAAKLEDSSETHEQDSQKSNLVAAKLKDFTETILQTDKQPTERSLCTSLKSDQDPWKQNPMTSVIFLGRGNSFNLGPSEVLLLHTSQNKSNTVLCGKNKLNVSSIDLDEDCGRNIENDVINDRVNEEFNHDSGIPAVTGKISEFKGDAGILVVNGKGSDIGSPAVNGKISECKGDIGRVAVNRKVSEFKCDTGGSVVDGKLSDIVSPAVNRKVSNIGSSAVNGKISKFICDIGGSDVDEKVSCSAAERVAAAQIITDDKLEVLWHEAEVAMLAKKEAVLQMLEEFGLRASSEAGSEGARLEEAVWLIVEGDIQR